MNIVEKSIQFAAEKYDGKIRKASNTPYIINVVERVVQMSYVNPDDADMMAAAALLKITKNTEATYEEIETVFGARIKNILVTAEVSDYSDFDNSVGEENLMAEVERIRKLPLKVKMLILADKLAYIKALQRDFAEYREDVFARLQCKNPGILAKYFYGIADTFHEFQEYEAYTEFNRGVAQLFVAYR